MRVFLLTKVPHSERTRLGLRLIARSPDAVVYLVGDGVYNLLDDGEGEAIVAGRAANLVGQVAQPGQALAELVPRQRIFACREDLLARGLLADGKANVPADFYEHLVEDMMREGSQVYCL
jgi:tRNA 2-thiouridine synthesizing protein B